MAHLGRPVVAGEKVIDVECALKTAAAGNQVVKVGKDVLPFKITPAPVAGAAGNVVDAVCFEFFLEIKPKNAHGEHGLVVRLTLKDFSDKLRIWHYAVYRGEQIGKDFLRSRLQRYLFPVNADGKRFVRLYIDSWMPALFFSF